MVPGAQAFTRGLVLSSTPQSVGIVEMLTWLCLHYLFAIPFLTSSEAPQEYVKKKKVIFSIRRETKPSAICA